MIRLKLRIFFPARGKEHNQGNLLISLVSTQTKILSKLNTGAIIGYILCNTFWTAQGSLQPTVEAILHYDLLQCLVLNLAELQH